LDREYIESLGEFDFVYSWGMLHHTEGHVAGAGERRLAGGGRERLFVAIYNDQGAKFRLWCRIKRLYLSGTLGRTFAWALFIPYFVFGVLATDLLRGRTPVARYAEYKRSRAMSMVHDWRDWLGGYPFEVAKLEEVFEFYRDGGFLRAGEARDRRREAEKNEFVFAKR